MNPGMKMLLARETSRNRDNDYRGNYNVRIGTYNEPDRRRYMEDSPEMRRRRDSRGRYMEDEQEIEMRYEDSPESRFRDRRGREHYDDGRYAPMRGMMDDDEDVDPRGQYPYFPPYMPRYERRMIGFGDDTMMMGESRHHEQMQRGMAEGAKMDLDQMSAEQWARNMEKEDGSKGPKWSKEQVKPYMAQVGYHGPEYKFWVIMNALYSDYCKIAKKYGVDRPEYYADLAKAWLEDADANPEKAGLYYKYIVKH
ncbi:MAG: hypothetical protein IKU26_08400 [Clostridia bacterium]|nr:hypothetical protein [Clostridia bacterium]